MIFCTDQIPGMDRFRTLKFFIAVSLLGGVCHGWSATYATGPVKAVKGSCVLVSCSTVPYSKVEWYYYQSRGYPVVYSRDTSTVLEQFRGRTSVPGSARSGDCTLKIDKVREEDGTVNLYAWIWNNDGDHKGFYDRTIKIDIVEPVRPRMSITSQRVVDKPFTATCLFRHSCRQSPPAIEWLGLSSTSNSVSDTETRDGLRETTSTATFRVTQQNQGQTLSCRTALNGQYFTSDSVSLNVQYAPTNVEIKGGSTVVEGNKITLSCTSQSNPAATQYKWVVTHSSINSHYTGETVTLQNVRRDTDVSCIAVNNIGEGTSRQLSLDVDYAPVDVRVVYTGSSTVVEGNTIKLRCSSTGRPAPTHYEWLVTHNNTSIRHTTDTVVLQNVRRDTSVSCISINSIGRSTSQQLSLNVHYAPVDVRVVYTGSSTVIEGNIIKLRCSSTGRPAPTHYEWLVTHNNTSIHHTTDTVVLQNVRRDTSVSCISINTIGRSTSQQLSLNVFYAPSILPGSVCSTQDGILKCVCQAESNPSAVITWAVDGSIALFPPFNITTKGNGNSIISQLTGPQGNNVNCTAKNSVGSIFIEIPDQHEEKNIIPMVSGAAVVCVIVLLLVIMILVFKKRRRAKTSDDLSTIQNVRPTPQCHDYSMQCDEELYANDEGLYANTDHNSSNYEEQENESCIYENYDVCKS